MRKRKLKLKRGYQLRLKGEPANEIVDAPYPKQVAVQPVAFRGFRPVLQVKEGDEVLAGTVLVTDKTNPNVCLSSPASGVVQKIQRGRRRVLEQIVIETNGKQESETFPTFTSQEISAASQKTLLTYLENAGVLPFFRQRPFDNVASPENLPRDIFISAFDSAPLAPDLSRMLEGNETEFQAGIDLCSRLTDGKVYLGLDAKRQGSINALAEVKNAETCLISGPHPAGCVGIQIHHLSPIRGRHDVVWHCPLQLLIVLGRLLLTGKLDTRILVAVTGSAATERKLYRTVMGASVDSLIGANVAAGELRYISGNVLTGTACGAAGFIGFYDHQLTVIPEAVDPEFIGWMLPGITRESKSRCYLSGWLPGLRFTSDTRLHGGRRAFVASNLYEDVLPMDILPVYLMKSILAEDIEEMEELGIYEVTEEEIALCEYVCPSKIEFQQILRQGLTLLEKEG